jgi:nicotinamide-nucleotide amidase
MNAVFRCFGEKQEVARRLFEINSELNIEIHNNCLDNTIYICNIEESQYYDILDEIDDIVYNDCDVSLEETFVEFLKNNELMVSVAESCTGGLLSASIVNVSGASKVFYEGVVTYSNNSKMNRLGVGEDTLNAVGAVSEDVAKEMAYGLLDYDVDLAISTTGIAGPDGGSKEKPVGLVYIGIACTRQEPFAIKNYFSGTREQIRLSTKNACLFYGLQVLKENY